MCTHVALCDPMESQFTCSMSPAELIHTAQFNEIKFNTIK